MITNVGKYQTKAEFHRSSCPLGSWVRQMEIGTASNIYKVSYSQLGAEPFVTCTGSWLSHHQKSMTG
ncbi:hypothetical protein JTB14_032945 [Gonioctena quinquepunctata]|nr:hypothetical protein JTB14_032945 [Gonioctena quinquepunctata]